MKQPRLFQYTFESDKDKTIWSVQGKRISALAPEGRRLYQTFFENGRVFIEMNEITYLKSWVDLTVDIHKRSPATAEAFLKTTPAFLSWGKCFQLEYRARNAIKILSFGLDREDAAMAYLIASSKMKGLLLSLIMKDWHKTGFLLAKQSASACKAFFSADWAPLEALYQTEIRRILGCVSIITKSSPEKGVAFYSHAPGILQRINPNVRENILKTSVLLSTEERDIPETFEKITTALLPFSYPVQEQIIDFSKQITEISRPSAISYFSSVPQCLKEIPEKYLHFWVNEGLALLKQNEKDGIRYFSLLSESSLKTKEKWHQATSFDDIKGTLSLFIHALSGRPLTIEKEEKGDHPKKGLYPEGNGYVIFLPEVIHDGKNKKENHSLFKVIAAHQAGYIEFSTFSPQYAKLFFYLDRFPVCELAFDIFYIIEDGRVDYLLKQEYAGLSGDIENATRIWLNKRPIPENPPVHAILEILLRLTIGGITPGEIPPHFHHHYEAMKCSLKTFYEQSISVWDSFVKTCELYRYIVPHLKNAPYTSFSPIPVREKPHPSNHPGDTPLSAPPDQITGADDGDMTEKETLLSGEDLEKLLESLSNMVIPKHSGSERSSSGLFLKGLQNALNSKEDENAPRQYNTPKKFTSSGTVQGKRQDKEYKYDEWDHLVSDYRKSWCTLREKFVPPDDPKQYYTIFSAYKDLIHSVKKQFQQIRPTVLETVRGTLVGDELYIPAVIQAVVDRKAGCTPSERIFIRKEKIKRRISTLLLIDMSASTGESAWEVAGLSSSDSPMPEKRIIDIEIESLVVMIEALESLDDEYGVYGFSGKGRDQVDFYIIKDFNDPYSETLKKKISGITPKQSTRMGTAIRHATQKLKKVDADHRLMILISDGFPQDLDYGENRKSKEYALNDTMMALIESGKEGIKTFCITVDQSGNDYLKKMCNPGSYLVIKDIYALPEILPKVVESLMC